MNKPAVPRILIVDDEERFRTTLAKLLTVRGLAVHTVGGAGEAFAELALNPYDVILLDVKMPQMNGVAALAEIKRTHPDCEVIIVSGHACVDVAVEIMKLGGYEYVLKPCPIDELTQKIDAAYERVLLRRDVHKGDGFQSTR